MVYSYDEVGNLLSMAVSLACGATLSATSAHFGAEGGTGQVQVAIDAGCNWTAEVDDPWLAITGGTNQTGSATIAFQVAVNTAPHQRSGSLTLAGHVLTVTQDPAPAGFQPDLDGNGTVDNADVALAVQRFLQDAGSQAEDCDQDGVFNLLDLICLYNIVDPIANPTVTQTSLLDIDSDGSVDALSDGLVMVRKFFGFSGAALVGVVPPGADRASPESQENYIEAFHAIFDIDLDGDVGPLRDGLLMVRYFFGFRGAALVEGIPLAGSQRDSAAAIEAYFRTLFFP